MILRPFAFFNACFRRVNISAAPSIVGTVLRRVPSSLCHRLQEHRLALGGTVSSRASRLALRSSGRVRTCFAVSIAQPRMIFFVLQVASPLRSFLRDMGSSRAMSSLSFGRKSSSMAQKRCRVICRLSVAPPWFIPMKSSRYTSMWARDVARPCGDRTSQSLLAASIVATSCSVFSGGFVSQGILRCGLVMSPARAGTGLPSLCWLLVLLRPLVPTCYR